MRCLWPLIWRCASDAYWPHSSWDYTEKKSTEGNLCKPQQPILPLMHPTLRRWRAVAWGCSCSKGHWCWQLGSAWSWWWEHQLGAAVVSSSQATSGRLGVEEACWADCCPGWCREDFWRHLACWEARLASCVGYPPTRGTELCMVPALEMKWEDYRFLSGHLRTQGEKQLFCKTELTAKKIQGKEFGLYCRCWH